MRFKPKTEEEVQSEGLWPRGEYDYEITEAIDATSKSGNDMIKLAVRIFNEDGNARTVFDYLLEEMAYKLRHAAYACGLGDKYEKGELQSGDFIGKCGRCKVVIKKDKAGQYPDQNSIVDYSVPTDPIAPVAKGGAALNDEIPF